MKKQLKIMRRLAVSLLLLVPFLTANAQAPAGCEFPCETELGETDLLDDFTPITDDILGNPADEDWPLYRRTWDMWGHSPLTQIDTDNVKNLALAWSVGMEAGINEATPLVYDGIMYLPNPDDVIYALDAKTGEFIWVHRRDLPSDAGMTARIQRNIAIYDDKVFAVAADGNVYALDARTGDLVWETPCTEDYRRVHNSAGPIVANGMVVSGHACAAGVENGCFISAHDTDSGEEMWRTYVIAEPGTPEGDTWGGLPMESRHHVNAWHVGAYDPELNLIYWGTSVPAPSPEIIRGSGDAPMLYSNSTLAIDADTGEIE